MEIRVATNTDKESWDKWVCSQEEHKNILPYHLFAWKNAVEEAYGHKTYYLLAKKEGKIRGILPLVYFKAPFLSGRLVSLPFCDIGGLLADNQDVGRKLVSEAIFLSEKLKCIDIELRMSEATLFTENFPSKPISTQSNKVRMILDLPGSSEKLMKGLSSNMRNQIRKSIKNGLTFRWGAIEDLDQFYSVFASNMKNLGSPVHSKLWIGAVLKHFGDKAKVGLVYHKNDPVGGGIMLCSQRTACIPWASALLSYNRLLPTRLLYWNFLEYAADNDYATFDFGRSTLGEGTYKFKSLWGTKPVPLYWHYITTGKARKNTNENHYSQNSNSLQKKLFIRIWRRLPLSMANSIGPVVRKYISL